ncbi:MAG: hypothetical protein LQ343_005752 [Gyalolechia ehrenbergii]|nr:MAG: hypothetical protein LQ343_005752 [Gyalolechia ehrenbergii]
MSQGGEGFAFRKALKVLVGSLKSQLRQSYTEDDELQLHADIFNSNGPIVIQLLTSAEAPGQCQWRLYEEHSAPASGYLGHLAAPRAGIRRTSAMMSTRSGLNLVLSWAPGLERVSQEHVEELVPAVPRYAPATRAVAPGRISDACTRNGEKAKADHWEARAAQGLHILFQR